MPIFDLDVLVLKLYNLYWTDIFAPQNIGISISKNIANFSFPICNKNVSIEEAWRVEEDSSWQQCFECSRDGK